MSEFTLEKARALASQLQVPPRSDLAFLVFEDTVYYALHSRKPHEPSSAILKLIQGIYELAPEIARILLRQKIYSTAATTELCHGAIKVAAKRVHAGLTPSPPSETLPVLRWIDAGSAELPTLRRPSFHPLSFWKQEEAPHSPADFLNLAKTLVSQIPDQEGPLYRRNREVAALLVSKEGEILSWGINTNHSNRTFHAELNLVQDFFARTGKPIPAGAKIFITLKPCKMCAGAIWVATEDPFSLEVYFSEFDSGRNARWTVLDVGSEERKNLARNPRERQAVLQRQI